MKRLSFIIGVSALFAWGLATALGGCGGAEASDVTAQPEPDGSTASSGSNGSSSSGPSSSSGSSGTSEEAGAPADGGVDGSSSGSASNPGKVTCGASECSLDAQFCCRGFNDAGCVDQGESCQGARVTCDEAADCDQGERCCLSFGGGGGGLRARCDNNCQSQFRVCKTDTECGDAGACTEKTCGTIKIRTCGTLVGCN